MRKYTEASKAGSTAGSVLRCGAVRRLAGALSCALTLAAACPAPTATSPATATPHSVVLAEVAPPYYSLQAAGNQDQWVAVFADGADLTLKLARGPLAAPAATVAAVDAIDRIDVPPGINPFFGRHAYLQHHGVEHLFYSDQELADARVTKWVRRETAGEAPWTVDLLPEAALPMAVLPVPAPPAEQGFTLFGLLGGAEGEPDTDTILAYRVLPDEVTAPITSVAVAGLVGAPGAGVSAYGCGGRSGFAVRDDTGMLLVEDAQHPRRITLEAAGPVAVGCHQDGEVVAYTRNDPQAMSTSSGPVLQAREIVAVEVAGGGTYGAEIKVTLAREVRVLAVFPEPPAAAAAAPTITVLFTELALDAAGEPEYRLSLVGPDGAGGYGKRLLVRGAQPVQDFRALRADRELIVVFRRGNQLRLLHTRLDGAAGVAAAARNAPVTTQAGGSW